MSDQRTAKVRNIENIRQWDGPHGTIWFHEIMLDNGDQGSIGKKRSGGIAVGEEITYTIEASSNGNKIKQVFEPQNNQGQFAPPRSETTGTAVQTRGGRGSGASFALSYSKDLMIAAMPYHPDVTTNQWIEATLSAATKFDNWLKEVD